MTLGLRFTFSLTTDCLNQVNGSSSAADDTLQTFHEVHLEAASSAPKSAPAATSIANENVAAIAVDDDGGRGERVKEEISMLSPMPQNPGKILTIFYCKRI